MEGTATEQAPSPTLLDTKYPAPSMVVLPPGPVKKGEKEASPTVRWG